MILLRNSITLKLLTLILPLVLTPILLVGLLSYQASVNSVTRQSRDYAILQAKSAAAQIDAIFKICQNDLSTIARLVIENSKTSQAHSALEKKTFPSEENLKILLLDFITRSPYYIQIRLSDYNGIEFERVSRYRGAVDTPQIEVRQLYWNVEEETGKLFHISNIRKKGAYSGYLVSLSQLIVDPRQDVWGTVTIDLDYDKIIELVCAIRIGKLGYGFLVDGFGRTIAHPHYEPHEYDLTRYDDPRQREFVIRMISGETGWMTFNEQGERAAAFSPVLSTGWSLAVSMPIDEYKREAKGLQGTVFQVVVVTFVVVGLVVVFVSHRFNRPVRDLVLATGQIASGDLNRQIPVKSKDELGLLTVSFNQMVESLRRSQVELIKTEKLAAMGRLSAGVAHEIRNPLNAMKGAITYLQRRRSGDGLVIEYTNIILEEIKRLGEFVTEFLIFARQSDPKRGQSDLNEIVQSALNLYEAAFAAHDIDIRLNLDKTLPMIKVDPKQLEQVFVNLFNNAMQAMPDGGKLKVSTGFGTNADGTMNPFIVWVKVRDSGIGIQPNQVNKVFEPFFSTKESGTGLGLAISLGIIEGHGGTLSITSIPEKETTVVVELPIE